MNTLQLFYANLNKQSIKTRKVLNLINLYKSSILTLVEVNKKQSFKTSMRPKTIISDQVCVTISSDIEIIATKNNVKNIVSVIIQKNGRQILIIAAYFNEKKLREHQLDTLKNIIDEYANFPIIFVGDVNCDHELWSYKVRRKNRLATEIAAMIHKNKYEIINKPKENNFSFSKGTWKSWIDLLFTNIKYEFDDMGMITDHRGYLVKLKMENRSIIDKMVRHKRHITNYKFRISKNLKTKQQIDEVANKINKFPRKFKKNIIKKQDYNSNRKLRRIRTQIKKMNRLFKKGIDTNFKIFKALKNKEQRYKQQRNENIYRYISTLDVKDTWTYINKVFKSKDQILGRLTEKLNYREYIKDYTTSKPQLTTINTFDKSTLSRNEIEFIKNMEFKKSSGDIDDFTLNQWRKFWLINKNELIKFIMICFEQAYIPQPFKRFGLKLIPKPDGKLRPIRLASYPLQIFDKILLNRLEKKIDDILLPNTQYARKGTDEIIFRINNLINEKKILAFLDISKAFDDINNEIIIQQLKGEIDSGNITMIKQFLQNKILEYKHNNITYYKRDNYGTSQGSALGPITFLIGLDYAIRKSKENNVEIFAYADDMVVQISRSKNVNTSIYDRIAKALNEIDLKLNTNKTKEVKMTDKNKNVTHYFLGKLLALGNNKPINIRNSIEKQMTELTATQLIHYLPDKINTMMINAYTSNLLYGITIHEFYKNEKYMETITLIQKKLLKTMNKTMSITNRSNNMMLIFTLNNVNNPLIKWLQNNIKILIKHRQDKKNWPILNILNCPKHDTTIKEIKYYELSKEKISFCTRKNKFTIIKTTSEVISFDFGQRMSWHELVINSVYQIKLRYKDNFLINLPPQITRYKKADTWMEITNILTGTNISWRTGYLITEEEPTKIIRIGERVNTLRQLNVQIMKLIHKINIDEYFKGKTLSHYLLLYPPRKIRISPFTRRSIRWMDTQIRIKINSINAIKKEKGKETKTLEHYLFECKHVGVPLECYYLDGINNCEIHQYVTKIQNYLKNKQWALSSLPIGNSR